MLSRKGIMEIIALGFALSGLGATLKAAYYMDTLFPIGFTGFDHTGYWSGQGNYDGSPYPDNLQQYPYGTWAWEDTLIKRTHCNFIGCSDGCQYYYMRLAPTTDSTVGGYGMDYYTKVCLPLGIMMAPNSGYTIYRQDKDNDGDILDSVPVVDSSGDTISWELSEQAGPSDRIWWPILRHYDGGYAPAPFDTCHYDSIPEAWIWGPMADMGAKSYATYFDSTETPASCFWGYNPFHEACAMYRGGTPGDNLWIPGVYAADTFVTNAIRQKENGAPFNGTHRMMIAKGQLYPLMQQEGGGEVNLFQHVPDIDAVLIYNIMIRGYRAYGSQGFFDHYLYGDDKYPKAGYHNAAVYMQEHGKTPGGPPGQKRRWMAGLQVHWEFMYDWSQSEEVVLHRRPCPPEIRAMAYLALSRGAKGLLFYSYLGGKGPRKYVNDSDTAEVENVFPTTASMGVVDSSENPASAGAKGVGLRDKTSKPCDAAYSPTTYLLDVPGSTTVWDGAQDNTFGYLCDLIPEIKAISDELMQLEWVSAYSLKSTCGKESSCPLDYVHSVTTTDSGYIDLGFFSPYYWQDQGEYLMVVNRDGIRDNQSDSITLYLDFPEGDSLYVIEYGDPDIISYLPKSGDGYFHLARDYAPGEGKLFRFYPIETGIDLPILRLWGECKKTSGTNNFMQGIAEMDTFCTELTWEWVTYKPIDLTRMELWRKVGDNWECVTDTHPTDEWKFTDKVFIYCDSCCNQFLEVGYHLSGYQITEPEELNGAVGTKSNVEEVCCNKTSGCPELYSLIHYDTTGCLFLENNTIMPHSEHTFGVVDDDLLKLDMLNTDPDHYYMSIVENASASTYLDQAMLWVVDHDEGTEVATSTDDSIYVYSEVAVPESCKDNYDNDRLNQVLWQDSLSFLGSANSYLIVEFDDPGWTNKGIIVYVDGAAMAKASMIEMYKVGGGGEGWDSIGIAYARLNSSQWLINVSDADSLRFRLLCGGSDTTRINRIALVKLDSNWTKREAVLDSAVRWIPDPEGSEDVKMGLMYQDTLDVALETDEQISLRFDKVDSSTTYLLRDYVFQSRGYYSTAITPPSGIVEEPLEFGLRVEQLTPLSRIALINYSVPYATHVKIAIYDVAGRLTKSVIDEKVKPGRYSEDWKGKDDAGRILASGVYFVKMITDDYKKTVKVVILE